MFGTETSPETINSLTRRATLKLAGSALLTAAIGGMALPSPARNRPSRIYAAAPPIDFDKDPVKIERIADNLHVIFGPGGNIAVLTDANGALLVDCGVPSRSADVIRAVKKLTPKPIHTLINTHWHDDHTGGNVALGKAGARIIAQANTRKRLSTDQVVEFMGMKSPAHPSIALPSVTFEDNATVYAANQEIALSHVDPAHTDTDIIVFFKEMNVLHAGDLLFNGFYPFIDYSSGGWIGGMVAASNRILSEANAQTRIIPGHGPLGTKDDVQRFRDMLDAVQTNIEPMVTAGKSVDEVIAAKPTAEYDAKWGGFLFNGDQFTRLVYTGIAKHNAIKI